MSVKLLDKPATTACPKCKTKVRLPARSAPSRPQPTFEAAPQTTITPQPAANDAFSSLPPIPPDSEPLDLGQLDLPQASLPGGNYAASSRTSASRSTSGSGMFAKSLLGWIGGHKVVTAIVALNVIALISAIFYPPLIVFCAIQVTMGLVIAGALFLPRFHLVERVSKAVGGQMASMGAGGVLLLILAIGAKAGLRIARRSGRNENLDFSGFDPSSLGAMAGALVTFICVSALIVFLWKQIGIVRVIAAGYLLEMSLMTCLLIVGGALNARRDAESNRRHEETIARMQSPEWRPPGFQDHAERMNSFRQRNTGGPLASEIRIIVMHSPDADLGTVKDEFLKRAGNPECETQHKGAMMTEFIIQDSRDPTAIADLIDFGRVLSVNSIGRMIRVGMPRVGAGNVIP